MSAPVIDPALESYLSGSAATRLGDYVAFLRIPSIGGMPAHAADTRACAAWLAARLGRAGLEAVEVSETGGHPVVYGHWLHAPGAPTVLVYGHYDVQPVDPLELWEKPPFEPRIEGGRIYARGASDDKGQVHIHISAIEALFATRGVLPVNLKVLFEGEEESGSEHLDAWLERNRARLTADLAVVSDSGFFEGNVPSVTYGLRGLVYAEIHVSGSRLDLHSGTYGGTVRNPAHALAEIIASFHDERGRVAIPGFYDEVVQISAREREALAQLPFDETAYAAGLGVPGLVGEEGYTTLERRWARPTLDVNGIWGGFSGEGPKTIIPAEAGAKVSCRLVPDQEPERIFERLRAHVLAHVPAGVNVDVAYVNGGRPTLTPIDHAATRAAAAALEDAFGQRPVYMREGGSVPVAASFARILGLPVVLLGFTPPDDQAHAPNESMRLDNYEGGIRTIVRYWDRLAAGAEK